MQAGHRYESLDALVSRHAATLAAALEAVKSRASWSPFKDSPSTKIHGPDKPIAGKQAFEARLGCPFELDQPGQIGRAGNERSPYTRDALGITYPLCDPQALIGAAQNAMSAWRRVEPAHRVAL